MERIRVGFRSLHEIWAALLQAGVASWMLYNRLGVVFMAPIGIVIVCFTALAVIVSFTGDSQRAWMAGVQKRVGLTAAVISNMKNVKISGLSIPVSNIVQRLRVEELVAGARFRKIFITAALFAFVPLLFSPPLVFAFSTSKLDASTMFTSLAFLSLLAYPLQQTLEAVPQFVSALACLSRIQAYLECETLHDYRKILVELNRKTEKAPTDTQLASQSALNIENGKFGWAADKIILRDVNTRITKSSLTIAIGTVGSGKSTLCKAILGEIPHSEGSVVLSTTVAHIGYCDQTAFLSNGSIRDNIVGYSAFNHERYEEVMNATALAIDLTTLPHGDRTNIGSDGITLSGGQRQRVALARALYLQSDLLVLDDVFSGLDADTEEHVFQQVFASGGLLRRRQSTVILCTHSVRHLPMADHILVLEDGTIAEQGSFTHLSTSQGYVQRLGLKSPIKNGTDNDEIMATSSTPKSKPQPPETTTETSPPTPGTDKSRQMGDKSVYKHYIRSMGWYLAALALFFASLFGFFSNFPVVWLSYWTNDVNSEYPKRSHAYYAVSYAFLQLSAGVSVLLLAITLWVVAVKKAGANLHQEALQTVIRAPLRFFTKTDTGVMTNLFRRI
jgi:ABC-type bacteriocin/lantibiotic exporter with double-glycine peptidase domain